VDLEAGTQVDAEPADMPTAQTAAASMGEETISNLLESPDAGSHSKGSGSSDGNVSSSSGSDGEGDSSTSSSNVSSSSDGDDSSSGDGGSSSSAQNASRNDPLDMAVGITGQKRGRDGAESWLAAHHLSSGPHLQQLMKPLLFPGRASQHPGLQWQQRQGHVLLAPGQDAAQGKEQRWVKRKGQQLHTQPRHQQQQEEEDDCAEDVLQDSSQLQAARQQDTPQQQMVDVQPPVPATAAGEAALLQLTDGEEGLAAFKAQLSSHLATYAASGGVQPQQVLAARRVGSGGAHMGVRQERAVLWYPLRTAAFLRNSLLSFPACVLWGLSNLVSGAQATLRVLVPGMQPPGGHNMAASSSVAACAMPGQLQLPGLWQEVERLEVTVHKGVVNTHGPFLQPAGGWGELHHLQDHYMLALSAVSGNLG
jgi:hypothetical protein